MGAAPQKAQLETVGIGGGDAGLVGHCPGGTWADVQPKTVVRLAETLEEIVRQHGLGAPHRLLGGLADEHHRAAPLRLQRDQRLGRPHPARHVDVVAAGVVDEGLPPFPDLLIDAGVGQAGLFLHGQGVKLGAHEDERPGAIAQDRDDAGLAHMLGHLKAQGAHLGGELGGGAHLLETDLGVLVDVLVEGVEARVFGVQNPVDRRLVGRSVAGRGHGRRRHQAKRRGARHRPLHSRHASSPCVANSGESGERRSAWQARPHVTAQAGSSATISFLRASGLSAGANLPTTLPDVSTRNLVKFHLTPCVPRIPGACAFSQV